MVIDVAENIQIQRKAINDKIAQLETDMKHQMDQVRADFRSLEERVDNMSEKADEMREDVNKMKSELSTVTQFTNAQRIEKAVVCMLFDLVTSPQLHPNSTITSDSMPFSNGT